MASEFNDGFGRPDGGGGAAWRIVRCSSFETASFSKRSSSIVFDPFGEGLGRPRGGGGAARSELRCSSFVMASSEDMICSLW